MGVDRTLVLTTILTPAWFAQRGFSFARVLQMRRNVKGFSDPLAKATRPRRRPGPDRRQGKAKTPIAGTIHNIPLFQKIFSQGS